ncbi:MAG TPA: CBS domain-containing protein [Methanosarcinales archaeon]|nr:CBS domain-containing protein [Methanosarcinales archaeon]
MKQKEIVRVKDVMTRGVITIPLKSTVKEMAEIMANKGISAVALVGSDGGTVGVVSEMDILKVIDEDLNNLPAENIMSHYVESVGPNTTLKEAAEIMCKKRIHRVLVLSEKYVGASYRPIGILSASDIVKQISCATLELLTNCKCSNK